ncbi:hypothetical protein [Cellulomonas shaoxiangyii]|uniref:hypothetical protein n=1 Tax=Cellulomonas shaoxiangyii TaxID=2566013 RepID=UPI001FB72BF4|nr:hypothetical protein [Cellulomonas shaoxiangyii]
MRVPEPEIPDDVTFSDLDRDARRPLRTLSKDNAERVGRHLVMVGRLLDVDPERAYEHATAAVRRAGRVDVVREAAGIAAYSTGRYAEALRELRTVRRLNGSSEHLAVMADAERGLGRPERAIALAQDPEAEALPAPTRVELAMVVSGARLDMGQPEAAVAALSTDLVRSAGGVLAVRVAQARAAALEAAGRHAEAAAELAPYSERELEEAAGVVEVDEEVLVYDLEDDAAEAEESADREHAADADAHHGTADDVRDDEGRVGDDDGQVGVDEGQVGDEDDEESGDPVSVDDGAVPDGEGVVHGARGLAPEHVAPQDEAPEDVASQGEDTSTTDAPVEDATTDAPVEDATTDAPVEDAASATQGADGEDAR